MKLTRLLVGAAAAAMIITPLSMQSASATAPYQWHDGNGRIIGSCAGTVINGNEDQHLYDAQHRAHPTATIRLYYSSANGGTNCAMVFDNKSGSHVMNVYINDAYGNGAIDTGSYSTYAGGVAIYRTNGHCVGWGGRITDGGIEYATQLSGHCS